MPSTEEQIVCPQLDTKLGQLGDRYAKAVERLNKSKEELEKTGEEVLKQMQKEGLDKCQFIGRECRVSVELEHVQSHDRLKKTVSALKD